MQDSMADSARTGGCLILGRWRRRPRPAQARRRPVSRRSRCAICAATTTSARCSATSRSSSSRAPTLAVIGANGAGKSTLLRILATLLRPSAGEVEVLGASLPREAWKVRGRIGYLGHEPLLYRELSVRENLELNARLHRRRATRRERIADLLERAGLARRAGELVRNLSAGHAPAGGDLPGACPRAGAAAARRAALPPRPGRGAASSTSCSARPPGAPGWSSRTRSTPASARSTPCWRCAPTARSPTRGPAADCRSRDARAIVEGRHVSAYRAILAKDLRVELRTLESVPAMLLFSATTFVLFRFGLDRESLSGSPRRRGPAGDGAVRGDPRDQPRLRRRARAGRLRPDPPGAGRRHLAVPREGLGAVHLPGGVRAVRRARVRDPLPRRRRRAAARSPACWRSPTSASPRSARWSPRSPSTRAPAT